MPYDSTPPNWRSRKHPLNALLHELGSGGGTPTTAELNTIPAAARTGVLDAARKINAHRKVGNFLEARREAEHALGVLGQRTGHLPLPEPEPTPEPTSLDDLASRMFGN